MRRIGGVAIILAAIALAGCTNGGGGGGSGTISDSGSVSIDEDNHVSFSFEANSPVTVSYTVEVTEGPNIDVFVMDNLNYQSYSGGGSFTHQQACDDQASSYAQNSCDLGEDRWHIVIDNTNRGGAQPPTNGVNDPAHVDYQYEAGPR